MKKSLSGCFSIYKLAENKKWFVHRDTERELNSAEQIDKLEI